MIDQTRLHEVMERVLETAVTVPSRPYYVNYDVKVSNYLHGRGTFRTTTKYTIGPYHKIVAEFLLEHWVPTQNTGYTKSTDCYNVVMIETISLKPKKGSVMGPAPTKEEMEALLLSVIVSPLEIYRELQQLPP